MIRSKHLKMEYGKHSQNALLHSSSHFAPTLIMFILDPHVTVHCKHTTQGLMFLLRDVNINIRTQIHSAGRSCIILVKKLNKRPFFIHSIHSNKNDIEIFISVRSDKLSTQFQFLFNFTNCALLKAIKLVIKILILLEKDQAR